MEKMIVKGQQKLSGEVTIGGAKNSTVALIPAAILADTPVNLIQFRIFWTFII